MDKDIERITGYILEEAEKKANKIRRQGLKEIERLLEEERHELEAERQRILERARAEGEAKKKTIIANANLEAKKALLEAKRGLMERVIQRAIDMISASRDDKKREIMDAIITDEELIHRINGIVESIEHIEEEVEIMEDITDIDGHHHIRTEEIFEKEGDNYVVRVIPPKEDDSWLTQDFIDKLNDTYSDRGVRVVFRISDKRCDSRFGCILTLGRIEIDCTIEAIITSKRKDLEKVIASHLFG